MRDDEEMMPEITHEVEQLVLEEIDSEWRDKFRTARAAWNFYWDFEAPLMQRLALDFHEEEQRARATKAILARRLDDTLADIGRGFSTRKGVKE